MGDGKRIRDNLMMKCEMERRWIYHVRMKCKKKGRGMYHVDDVDDV